MKQTAKSTKARNRRIVAMGAVVLGTMVIAACANPLEGELNDLKNENKDLKEQNAAQAEQINNLNADKTALAADKTRLQAELAEAIANGADPAEITRLQNKLDSVNGQLAQNNALFDAIEWANSNERQKRSPGMPETANQLLTSDSNADKVIRLEMIQEGINTLNNDNNGAIITKDFIINKMKQAMLNRESGNPWIISKAPPPTTRGAQGCQSPFVGV